MKAALISLFVLTFRVLVFNPILEAAASTSRAMTTATVLARATQPPDTGGTGRIDQHAQQRCLRQQYTQELQTLRGQLGSKKVDTCSVASWLRNARDKTDPDRIFADGKDNRNGVAGSFGGQSRGVSCRHNHGNPAANQLLSEGR